MQLIVSISALYIREVNQTLSLCENVSKMSMRKKNFFYIDPLNDSYFTSGGKKKKKNANKKI